VEVDLTLDDFQVNGFDAIIFIGGAGAQDYFENARVHQIIREAFEKGKIIGAICIAPAILAKAGILKGKNATVWSTALDKSAVKILQEGGAIWQDGRTNGVTIDGKIITANGPDATQEFAEEISKLLM
jgi:protease I